MNSLKRKHILYACTILLSVLTTILVTVIACCVDLKLYIKAIIVLSGLIFLVIIWTIVILITTRKKEDIKKQNIIRVINKIVDDYVLNNDKTNTSLIEAQQVIDSIKKMVDLINKD